MREISALLVSPGLYGSADAFNRHMRDKFTDLVLARVLARLDAHFAQPPRVPAEAGLSAAHDQFVERAMCSAKCVTH